MYSLLPMANWSLLRTLLFQANILVPSVVFMVVFQVVPTIIQYLRM